MTSDNLRVISGVAVVAAAGTIQQLVAAARVDLTRVLTVTIRAHFTNTNNVYVGSNADAPAATGYRLRPGETVSYDVGERRQYIDLSQIWLDVDTAGEGVSWTALREF